MTWALLIKQEVNAIFTNKAIMMTVFLGVIFYSFLYPLPYSQQSPKEQAVAVINLDNSQLSRSLERMFDATPQIKITQGVQTIAQAKALLINHEISGFVIIPKHFYRDLLLEKSPQIAVAADASYFLIYGTIIEGVVLSSATLAVKTKITRMVIGGENIEREKSKYSPILLNMKPTFNASIGYINYVVPAVFVLILHQTLLIAMGLLTANQYEKTMQVKLQNGSESNSSYWLNFPVWKILVVRAIAMLFIYSLLFFYYFGFSFEYFGISRLAHIGDLLAILLPFLLSVIFLGIVMGLVISRKELATVIVLLTSLPLVFSAGFIWPASSIPTWINVVTQFFPSTPAINAFLRLNQMGDSMESVKGLWQQLWLLTCLFFAMTYLLMVKKQHQVKELLKEPLA